MAGQLLVRSITYDYDPLYRLTAADYDDGTFFHYTYDPVGNRLTEVTQLGTTSYVYDIANRLTSVDGVTYAWDSRSNLLSDGLSTYSYDRANRLTTVVQGANTYTFGYNGLGDRFRQTVNGGSTNYTLDMEGGLTQVLADGANTYLYGLARVGEEQPGGRQYHLGDALASVRQVADSGALVAAARAYGPFGSTLTSIGSASTSYGFTGEWEDATGLIHLRARYLSPVVGRFFQADPWPGDTLRPQTLNGFAYVSNNPATWVDPSGRCYGDFDFLRSYERQNCENLDMALIILASGGASEGEKRVAGAFVGAWTVGHAYLGAGVVAMALANPVVSFGGALFSTGYLAVQRELAASGACGCEAQQWARTMDAQKLSRQAYIQGFAGGSLFGVGGMASPVTVLGALGQIAIGATGFGISAGGISFSAADIASNGPNLCNALNLGGSTAGLLGSTFILGRGLGRLETALRPSALPAVAKGAVPHQPPLNVEELLALEEAYKDGGTVIIRQLADEPRLVSIYGAGEWVKRHYVHRSLTGQNVVIHWFENLTTGQRVEPKFIYP